jgi:hypothetical protein
MQLIFQFNCNGPLLNEFPNNLQLLACASFKTLRVMEDKVASWVGNLVLNIMYAPLKLIVYQQVEIYMFHHSAHLH